MSGIVQADRMIGRSRTPREAAAQSRADRASGILPHPVDDEIPALPVLWARWATMAATFVAAGSPGGPRIVPSVAWYESAQGGGSTLTLLPGGRAVLSGGMDHSARCATTAALFAGAPHWVADPVLNRRAEQGVLAFCYWWQPVAGGRWFRGESAPPRRFGTAMPGVWTADTVIRTVAGAGARYPNEPGRTAAALLLTAAEVGVVTAGTVHSVFGRRADFDTDGALLQFSLAGLVATVPVTG